MVIYVSVCGEKFSLRKITFNGVKRRPIERMRVASYGRAQVQVQVQVPSLLRVEAQSVQACMYSLVSWTEYALRTQGC